MHHPFDPEAYGPILSPLLRDMRLNPLGPGTPVEAHRRILSALSLAKAFAPYTIRDEAMARACHAGLWLFHNFLDESHTLSQDIATTTGSFWHAIMHRREPDPSNSKYWWRKVAAHPVLNQLVEKSPALGYRFTDPYAFVDFVELVRDTGSGDEETAQKVQLLEWRLLFDWCFQKAIGE